jgi:class 3 adenylate cyclase/tetratricopeptide (TPR) repeat protein
MNLRGSDGPVQRQPFVSQLAAYALGRFGSGDLAPEMARHECEGVLMFADVTGFTAWTERLVLENRRGAEQVASRLDQHFEVMLDVVGRWGGLVHGFAGDATIVAWPTDLFDDRTLAIRNALGCAHEIQQRVRSSRDPSLGLMAQRIAVGAGALVLDRVGGVDGRWHLLAGGSVWDQVKAADAHASVGDVVASSSCVVDGGAMLEVVEVGDDCWRVVSCAPLTPARPHTLASVDGRLLDAFVSVGTLEQLRLDHAAWLAEFRRVTAMFVLIQEGTSVLPLATAQRIDRSMQQAISDYEGDLVYLRYDDKGLVALVAFGTALRSHEDDAQRAVHLAARLRDDFPGGGQGLRIGVSTGAVFAGLVGGAGYREYTVHGDVVNRAARLMQNAPTSTTVCDATTRDAACGSFEFDELEPLVLKGVAERVAVYRPTDARRIAPQAARRSLIGRTREIAMIEPLIRSVEVGSKIRLVNLRGEAGVGKSAMIDHIRIVAATNGLHVLAGAGNSIRRSEPYSAWRELFAGFVDEPDSYPGCQDKLEKWRQDRRAGLLGAVLDSAPLDSPFVSRLDVTGRADTTREFLVEVLGDLIADHPALLILDDVQWLDSSSWQLLELLVRRSVGALVVTAARPLDDSELPSEARRVLGSADSIEIGLGPLSRDATDGLIADRLDARSVSDELGRRVFERTEGHALFTEQMVLSLRDQGVIRIDPAGAHFAPGRRGADDLDFPDGVESVVTSRVDRLSPETQLTLKVASVVGRDFSNGLLAAVHPIDSSIPDLDRQLAELCDARLLEPMVVAGARLHRFRHSIIGDTAYGLLISSQQRELHRAIAEQLERDLDGSETEAAVLAHHWSRAEVDDRAIHYLDLAARNAVNDHASMEARELLLDVLARVDNRPDLADDERRARWFHLIGKVEVDLGDYSSALTHLSAAVATLDEPMPGTAFETSVGLLRQLGRHTRVRRGKAPPIDDERETTAVAEAYALLAEIHYNYHRLEAAMYATVAGANLALRLPGASPVAAMLQSNLAIAAAVTPSWTRQADHYSRASIDMAAELDDPSTWARVLLLVGTYEFGEARWDDAREHYERAMTAATEGGERKLLETAAGGLGNVHRMLGEFRRADAIDERVWDWGRDRGVAQSQVWGGFGRVSALCSLNRVDDLGEMLDTFGRLLGEAGTREQVSASNVVAYLATTALLEFHSGNDSAAIAALDEALVEVEGLRSLQSYMCCTTSYLHDAVLAASRRDPASERSSERARAVDRFAGRCAKVSPIGGPRALLTAGDLQMMAGRPAAARRSWRRSLRLAERLRMPFDAARAHHVLSTRGASSAEQSALHQRQLERLLGELAIDEPFAWTV